MIYIMSAVATHMHQPAGATGLFRGISTHHIGDGCWDMHFDASAISAEQSSVRTSATYDP